VSTHHLNLSRPAWRQLRRSWGLGWSPYLAWQSGVVGSLLSLAERAQQAEVARRSVTLPQEAVFILGYWRSGTTLLHELMALDPRFCAPSTRACMNPQNFLLAKDGGGRTMRRPMDDMVIGADTPQEDEFALLALGARSPYEALLVPGGLRRALALADPANLSVAERRDWERVFRSFLLAMCSAAPGRTLLLKSPPHACRIAMLLSVLPQARFVLLTRDPVAVFESAVRMWMSLFKRYSLTGLPSEDAVRGAVLATRPDFERAMLAGLSAVPDGRLVHIRFEDLVADPAAAIESVYAGLDLGAPSALDLVKQEWAKRCGYRPTNAQPAAIWRDRIAAQWPAVLATHREGISTAR
jgi:omega-hydroxy-beta-dihydromenaquinone-9 sulfotransferase